MTREQPPGAREWIKCSKRMPSIGQSVLICGPSSGFLESEPEGRLIVCYAIWTDMFNRSEPYWCNGARTKSATHWMPLPAPPTRTEGKGE